MITDIFLNGCSSTSNNFQNVFFEILTENAVIKCFSSNIQVPMEGHQFANEWSDKPDV